MMEKIPTQKRESGMSRIIGFDESTEQGLLDYFRRQFEKNQREAFEQEHTEEIDSLISQVNEKMKEFLARYGIQSLDIAARNIHIIDKSKLSPEQIAGLDKRYERTAGVFLPDIQQIVVFRKYLSDGKLYFSKIITHEMIHMNSFVSAQKSKEGEVKLAKGAETVNLSLRRLGFEINSAKTGKRFFYYVNETLTEELTIRFDHNYFPQIPDLGQELEERKKAIRVLAKKSGESKKDLEWLISNLEYKKGENGQVAETVLHGYSYHDQRKKLNRLISDLYENNEGEFRSLEDVFTLFAKVALTGRLLPVARLIEKTYGKGSFKELGEETAK